MIDQVKFGMWLATRPQVVRELATKFPPGTQFNIHGTTMHVMSYDEDGGITVTDIDPFQDYEAAVEARQPVCPCCTGNLDSLVVR